MPYAIKIITDVLSITRKHNNRWVESFDPEYDEGRGRLWTTGLKSKAMQFDSPKEAMEFYRQQSKTVPIRPTDGLPNRPLTAYTITIENI